MSDLVTLLRHPLVLALGWALLHFLWQGAVIALLLAGLLRLRTRGGAALLGSAQARYLAAGLALLLMAACPVITWAIYSSNHDPAVTANSISAPGIPAQVLQAGFEKHRTLAGPRSLPEEQFRLDWIQPFIPTVVIVWLIGVGVLSLRLLGGWAVVLRLGRLDTRPVEAAVAKSFAKMCQQMGIGRPVRLVVSGRVEVPTTLGWLRAVILLPAGILTGLPPGQLEALLAHELAHIRRHDYLLNLLQSVAETLLFYHPAVWWISRCIRNERENCCDDLAVAALGDRLTYARALCTLENLRAAQPPLALAGSGGDLLARIRRIVELPFDQTRATLPWTGGIVVVTLLLAAVAAVNSSLAAPPRPPASPTPNAPVVQENSLQLLEVSQPAKLKEKSPSPQPAKLKSTLRPKEKADLQPKLKTTLQQKQKEKVNSQQRAKEREKPISFPQRPSVRPLVAATPEQPVVLAKAQQETPNAQNGKKAPPPGSAGAKAVAQGVKGGVDGGIVKGVPTPNLQDIGVLDLRGVPAGEVSQIRSLKDIGVVVLDSKNRSALKSAKMEDIGGTVVAEADARIIVEPFLSLSKAVLQGMPSRQKLILVGIVGFSPDVTPALIAQKFASLNVTGVVLSTAGVRGALLGMMQLTGTSVTLPENAGPVTHTVGFNEMTTGYLNRLPDNSVYVSIGATKIAKDVTEQLLTQKISTYVNIGATIGPAPILEVAKTRSTTNLGVFTTEDDDDEKNED